MKTIIATEMEKAKTVRQYARDLPLFDTEIARLIALWKATRRLSRVLSPLTSEYMNKMPTHMGRDVCNLPGDALNPWFREQITDALNEVVAHLEILGALKEIVEFACTAHRKNRQVLLEFIREVAASKSSLGAKARNKLKEWNLDDPAVKNYLKREADRWEDEKGT